MKPYEVIKELDVDPAWKEMRGSPAAKWGGNQFVAIWRQMKWGNEDLVVYELVNDKVKREEKIWPEVVKYFDRDLDQRFLKKYRRNPIATHLCPNSDVKSFEFKDHKLLLDISARKQTKPCSRSGLERGTGMRSGISTKPSSTKSISSLAKLVFGSRKTDNATWKC